MKVLVIDQNLNCLSNAKIQGDQLGIQIDKLKLPNKIPPHIDKIKHLSEEFASLFYEMYMAGITDEYDYVILDYQWIDVLLDGQCRYCQGAFNALEKMKLVKQLILVQCDGIERITIGQALEIIAASKAMIA